MRSGIGIALLILLALILGGGAGLLGVKYAMDAGYISVASPETAKVTQSEEANPPAQESPDVEAAEGAEYGPDWPVCRDMSNDPALRIGACSRLLETAPLTAKHRSWTYNNRGTGYEDLRQYQPALKDYEAANVADPTNHAPYYNLGRIAFNSGRPKQAIALYDKALSRKPEAGWIYCSKARALQVLGQLDGALAALDKVPAPDKQGACALRQRGEIALAKGDSEAAINYFRKAEDEPVAASESQCRAGEVLYSMGRFEEALKAYTDGVRLNPENECAVANMARLIEKLRPPQEAMAALDDVMARYPTLTVLQCSKASILEESDAAAAFKLYDEVIAKYPTQSCALFQRAHLMFRMGDPDSALAAYTAGLKIAPNDYAGWYGRGQVGFYLGETETAISDLDKALAFYPDSYDVPMQLGEIYLYTRQYETALGNFTRASEVRPGDRSAAFFAAEAKLELGRFDEVIAACQTLINTDADDSVGRGCLQHRARAFLGLQKPNEAVRELQSLAAKEGPASGANLYLTALHLLSGDRDAAEKVLSVYRAARPDDLYGALLAQLMTEGDAAPPDISAFVSQNDIWPQPLLLYAMGDISAEAVMLLTAVPDFGLATMRAAEAEFYIGTVLLMKGETDAAMARFRRLKSENPVVLRKKLYPALYKPSNRLEVTLARWMAAQ